MTTCNSDCKHVKNKKAFVFNAQLFIHKNKFRKKTTLREYLRNVNTAKITNYTVGPTFCVYDIPSNPTTDNFSMVKQTKNACCGSGPW